MRHLFSRRLTIVCLGLLTAICSNALEKTIKFNRDPDSYSYDKYINNQSRYYAPVFIEGKVRVECGLDVYCQTGIATDFSHYGFLYFPENTSGDSYSYMHHMRIHGLPFLSSYSYSIKYRIGIGQLKEQESEDVYLFDLFLEPKDNHEVYVEQITLTYGNNFVWDKFQYSLLTDETAQVERCENSSEVVVPSVLYFAMHGFYDVTVTTVYNNAFANLDKLTKLTLPSTIESIKGGAFVGSPNLTAVVVQSVTPPTLNATAFDAAAAQNIAVYVPAESYSAYKAAPVWKDLNLVPSGDATAIDNVEYTLTPDGMAVVTGFDGDIETVSIPSSVSVEGTDNKVAIGLLSTQSYPNLKSIYIGEDVDIQALSGSNVPNLKKLFYLGTSAPAVNTNAMAGYSGNDVQVYGVNEEAIAGIVAQIGGTARVYPMINNRFTAEGLVYIPTSTADRTCDLVDYDYVQPNAIVPEKVTYRNVAFTIKNVNPYLFHQAKSIQSITVNNALPLPSNFAKETAVETVELNCGDIPAQTFINNTNLSRLTVNAKGDIGAHAFENSATSLTGKGAVLELNNAGAIETKAFSAFGAIDLLHVGKNVTAIKPSAFVNSFAGEAEGVVNIECNGIIGEKAFYNTFNIKSLTIAEGVTGIEPEAFRKAMTTGGAVATLNNSGSIGVNSFRDNTALTNVTIGDGCTSIAATAFADNESLKTVTFGNGCETIADQVFANNTALETVVFGDGVKAIGNELFKGDTALKEVTFGGLLESLGNYVFDNCAAMQKITVRAVNPPTCGTYVFRHIDKWNCELLVHRISLDAYKTAPQWNEFMNLASIVNPDDVTDIVIDPDSDLNDIFADGLAIFVNDTKDIAVKVLPETAIADLKWSCSDEAVATVADGRVTGIAAGDAIITITAGDFTKSFSVTVSKREQTIEWNQEIESAEVGATIELTAVASSSLCVEYAVITGDATIENSTLSVNGSGDVTVEASQRGNDEYLAAEPVRKTFKAVSGVGIVVNEEASFKIEGNELVIIAGTYFLYNLQGAMLEKGASSARIALLPNTPYILNINGQSVKLMAK